MFYCKFCGYIVNQKECRNCGAEYEVVILCAPKKTDYNTQNEERVGYDKAGNRVKV